VALGGNQKTKKNLKKRKGGKSGTIWFVWRRTILGRAGEKSKGAGRTKGKKEEKRIGPVHTSWGKSKA